MPTYLPHNPRAQVQSRQLNHSTPTHKAAPSLVPSVHRRVQLGLQATENSNFPPCLQVGDTGACLCFRVAESSGTCFIISEHVHLPQQVVQHAGLPLSAEKAQPYPPDRRWDDQTQPSQTALVPLQPGIHSFQKSPVASVMYRPCTENQGDKVDNRQGLCLRERMEISLEGSMLIEHCSLTQVCLQQTPLSNFTR